jgi:hypothetical protein
MQLHFATIHALICAVTFLLMAFIVAYLKGKPATVKSLALPIQIDLCYLTGLFVTTIGLVIIVRQINGPFQTKVAAQLALLLVNSEYSSFLSCILIMQFTQVLINMYISPEEE